MALLRVLTLVYAGVLVAALATALIVIAVYLWRIARVLGDVRAALGEVRDRTAPLRQHLGPLEALTAEHVQEFEDAASALDSARDRLDELGEQTALAR
jgi:hypothetical protein